MILLRSSHRRCSIKNGILKNFPKFLGKDSFFVVCQVESYRNVLNLSCRRLAFTSYKKETPTQVLSLEFWKIFNDALSGLRQISTTEKPLKMIKKGFYFALKSLFVLKIFKVLYWLFGHLEKQLDCKDNVDFKI